jgi:hypothetical protein
MSDQKFIASIEARMSDAKIDEKIINFVIGKVKQSFRNGVSVGEKQSKDSE